MDWTAFEHPQLGPVEIGGWKRVFFFRNPPGGEMLQEMCHKNVMFNLKLSMLMFNYSGDSRPRNNGGLQFEPQLGFWTGMFFALGFLYALFHWKRQNNFVFLMWLMLILCNSIFSVEAPSALRSMGNIPVTIVFSCIGIRNLWGQWIRITR